MPSDSRYARQSVLPEIGPEGQAKIAAAKILCIGAGGLGCPALLYLAAAGVGQIGIVDFDTVEESNLQRQTLFTMDQIGCKKAEAAKERLSALNPEIIIEAFAEELTDTNAVTLFDAYDIVIDGTDNFATKFLINDAALKTGTPFIYGSILGFDGQLSVFNLHNGPCYRCLFPEPPSTYIPNCAQAGVIGAVAGMIGTAQAMEALKIVLGHPDLPPLSGKLWTINLRTMENRLLVLPKDLDCPLCSCKREEITLKYSSPVCGIIPEVTPTQACERCEKDNALLVDVRETEEWDAGHIEGARHIPLSALAQGLRPDLPDDCEIILYCQKGLRGQQATQILRAQGCLNISNMQGGYALWLDEKPDDR
ncbi:MAG: HesA/MoeB/ThiF family protein [Alphaproteobacteria bacterium]|nr:HesA/MoeB/ThiF family protein [Alphaproteobacteria bacterium]